MTPRLGFMIAHRPGFTAPTLAARQFATLGQLSAAKNGRNPRFSLSLRPILAETEDEAWGRANAILQRVKEIRAKIGRAH
jgi:alkanesulfonate monooxygenase SsuD/methylene tetrahydromethanopterin reductase-like flavin-dependent oxidoreductase (luciferase family)